MTKCLVKKLFLVKEAKALIWNMGVAYNCKKYVKSAKKDLRLIYIEIGKFQLGKTPKICVELGRLAVARAVD